VRGKNGERYGRGEREKYMVGEGEKRWWEYVGVCLSYPYKIESNNPISVILLIFIILRSGFISQLRI